MKKQGVFFNEENKLLRDFLTELNCFHPYPANENLARQIINRLSRMFGLLIFDYEKT